MTNYIVPLNVSTYDDAEINAAKEVLDGGYVTMGSLCKEFETKFSQYLKVPHSTFVNSGSSANLLALNALQVEMSYTRNNDALLMNNELEVIVPALTWSTSVFPIIQCGFKPVFVDSDPLTLQMNTAHVEQAITDKTVAIMAVHVLGNTCNMDHLIALCDKHRLVLIEDCCESLGAKYKDKYVGSFGDFSTFSFFFSHHITTIEGGMVCSRTAIHNDQLRMSRSHGWSRHLEDQDTIKALGGKDLRFLFLSMGYNLRPTEINAAFGLRQLTRLSTLNERRKAIASMITQEMYDLNLGIKPMAYTEGADPALFGYPVLCDSEEQRDDLRNFLESNGIETRPIIAGNLVKHPVFTTSRLQLPHRVHTGGLAGADKVHSCGLFWGLSPFMTVEMTDHLISTLGQFNKAGS